MAVSVAWKSAQDLRKPVRGSTCCVSSAQLEARTSIAQGVGHRSSAEGVIFEVPPENRNASRLEGQLG